MSKVHYPNGLWIEVAEAEGPNRYYVGINMELAEKLQEDCYGAVLRVNQLITAGTPLFNFELADEFVSVLSPVDAEIVDINTRLYDCPNILKEDDRLLIVSLSDEAAHALHLL